jgi:hypothetical protein
MISGTLAVGMADGAHDEADAGLVESAEGVVEVDGMPAAMLAASRNTRFSLLQGRSPVSRLVMTACQSMWASSVTPSDSEVPVLMKHVKSPRRSHPVLMGGVSILRDTAEFEPRHATPFVSIC